MKQTRRKLESGLTTGNNFQNDESLSANDGVVRFGITVAIARDENLAVISAGRTGRLHSLFGEPLDGSSSLSPSSLVLVLGSEPETRGRGTKDEGDYDVHLGRPRCAVKIRVQSLTSSLSEC